MPTPSEQKFIDKMVTEGWEVHKNGFPDFLCVKDGKTILVEIKGSQREKLHQHQYEMLELLISCNKPEGFVWVPGIPEIIPFREYQNGQKDMPNKYLLDRRECKKNVTLKLKEKRELLEQEYRVLRERILLLDKAGVSFVESQRILGLSRQTFWYHYHKAKKQ